MIDEFLDISYKLVRSENFENFLKASNIGVVSRKVVLAAIPTIRLTFDEGKYTFHTISAFRHLEISFKLNEEVEEETFDGRVVRSVFSFEENKLVHLQKGDHPISIIREFFPDRVDATFTVGNVVATRIYERLR